MNPRLRSILIGIGLLTLVIIAIVLIPRGLSIYYQSRGGQHIDYVTRSMEGIQELVCEPLPESNQSAIEEVEQGIDDLQRAVRFNRRSAQSYYHLGKAYCLLGAPDDAMESYQQYTQLRPDNPLGHIGLGIAYYEYCRVNHRELQLETKSQGNAGELCHNQDVNDRIKTELMKAGIDRNRLLQVGNQAFEDREFEQSIFWFYLSDISDPKANFRENFPWMVSEFLLDKPINKRNQISTYYIDDVTIIEAESMYWLTPPQLIGKEVRELPSNDPDVGVLWTNGTAIALIKIPKDGEYELKLRAMDSPPSPINFQVEIDFSNVEEFSFSSEELIWREVVIKTTLDEGPHVIGVSFLNDGVARELDRNLIFDWIRISGPQR